jgi:hypothetical protein
MARMLVYSVDPDYLFHCPTDGTRTHLEKEVSSKETMERCPSCSQVYHVTYETDDEVAS